MGITISSGPRAQEPKPQMAEDRFKNVQVLKGIPVDEFMDTMGMISSALGLNCLDCHTSDSDTAWERFAVWMALGLLLYFSYGRWHSVLAKRGSVPFEGKSMGDAQSH